jgi:hypothetical protein
MSIVSVLLPHWQVWPATFLNGITYLSTACGTLNFLFPVADLTTVFIFIINFEVAYLTAKIVVKIFNYVRGTGSGLDI